MGLQQAFASAQEKGTDANVRKAIAQIDKMVEGFIPKLGRNIDKFLKNIAAGNDPYHCRHGLRDEVSIDENLRLTTDLLLEKAEELKSAPAVKKLLSYCAAPGRDACVTLHMYWRRSLHEYHLPRSNGISASVTIDPARSFKDSELVITDNNDVTHMPLDAPPASEARTGSFFRRSLRNLPVAGRFFR